MKVLGIDPGYDRIGVAVLEGERGTECVVFSDCIVTNRSLEFSARMAQVLSRIEEIFEEYKPDACALEAVFFSGNQKTALRVAEMRGALIWCTTRHGCPVAEYTPLQVKQAVTGYGRSDKQAVTDMLSKLLALPPGKRLDDEYDAIAIALTHMACFVPTLSPRSWRGS